MRLGWRIRGHVLISRETTTPAQRHYRNGSTPVASPRILNAGDGRETAQARQWNIGFLARETFGACVKIVGFSTFSGTVTARPSAPLPRRHREASPRRRYRPRAIDRDARR